jgi:hypothetical protein
MTLTLRRVHELPKVNSAPKGQQNETIKEAIKTRGCHDSILPILYPDLDVKLDPFFTLAFTTNPVKLYTHLPQAVKKRGN